MPASITIPCDLDCLSCGYNLRGLSTDGKCPECGAPVTGTLAETSPDSRPELEELIESIRRTRFESVAEAAGCTVDAVMLARDVLNEAVRAASAPFGEQVRHIGAREVCSACGRYCAEYFNDRAEATELLTEWGLRTSEDLGRIIFAMVHAGWVKARPEDSPRDFDNLFTLKTLFPPNFK